MEVISQGKPCFQRSWLIFSRDEKEAEKLRSLLVTALQNLVLNLPLHTQNNL